MIFLNIFNNFMVFMKDEEVQIWNLKILIKWKFTFSQKLEKFTFSQKL